MIQIERFSQSDESGMSGPSSAERHADEVIRAEIAGLKRYTRSFIGQDGRPVMVDSVHLPNSGILVFHYQITLGA